MGLISWYPLNSDLSNSVLDGLSLVNTNCILHNSGKIGKCYEVGTNGNLLSSEVIYEGIYTFSMWGYLYDSNKECMLFTINNNYGPCLYFSQGVISWNNSNATVNAFTKGGVKVVIPSINTWHLYTVISNNYSGVVDLYIDCEYMGSAKYMDTSCASIILGNYVYTNYYWLGRLNDFRVYDYALSVAEIHEIYTAKILHYDFGILEGGKVRDISGYNNHGLLSSVDYSKLSYEDVPRGIGKYNFGGADTISCGQLFFDDINQSWTISVWVNIIDDLTAPLLNNFNKGNYLRLASYAKAILYLNSGVNDSYVYANGLYPLGKWIHICYVHDRESLTCKIYKDGVEYGSSGNYTDSDIPYGFSASTIFGKNYVGYMSDLRVYASGLSSKSISDLYNYPVTIDNHGNLMVSSLDMVSETKGVNKFGKIIASDIKEAFTPGITSLKADNDEIVSLECRWDDVTHKMEYRGLSSFVCLGVNIGTVWSSSIEDLNIFSARVIFEIGDNISIYCNEVIEYV